MPEHRTRQIGAGQDYVKTFGGVYVPPWSEAAPEPKPLCIGLFSGAGGFDLGMVCAGFHVIAASEWWPVAAHTYLVNMGTPDTLVYVGKTAAPDATKKERALFAAHGGELVPAGQLFDGCGTGWIAQRCDHEVGECAPHLADDEQRQHWFHDSYCGGGRDADAQPCELFFLCDVHELTGELILGLLELDSDDIACVVGGPPCQGFSHANANRGKDDGRNQLVFEFARLVCEIHPKTMIMENVPGIVSMVTPEGIPVLDALSKILEDGGMGEYDALRKSLLTTSGAGAIVKTRKKPSVDDHGDVDEELDAQLTLEVTA